MTVMIGELKAAIRDAAARGATFRICGADITIDGLRTIPDPIARARHSGFLYSWLAGDEDDNEALAFCRTLDVEPVLVETLEEALVAVKTMTPAAFVGLDIETAPRREYAKPRQPIAINTDGSLSAAQPSPHDDPAGLDPHLARIASLQLYAGGKYSYVFRGEALRLMLGSKWLRQQHLVAHNAGFEIKFLRHHTKPVEGVTTGHPIECTLQAAGLVIGVGFDGEKRRLDRVAPPILGLDPPKALQTSDWGAPRLSRGQLAYAASDAALAWRLWPKLKLAIDTRGRSVAYQLQRDVIPAIADMELRGLGIDLPEHAQQVEEWSRRLANARREYVELTGNAPPSKMAEVRDWLAEVAGERLATWPKTKGGELSIERKYLKWLILSGVESVKPVLAMLAMEKLIANFGPKLTARVSPATGRLHCHYHIGAAKSGRFTSSKPNLQQLPNARAPEFRRCIVAAPGHVLVSGDWTQVELRAAAWLAKDRALTRIYEEGRDLHRETAAAIARLPYEAITDAQRRNAKPVNFGAIYGIGPTTLAEDAFDNYAIEITEAEARQALDRFFQIYSGYNNWRWEHWRRVKASGRVIVPGSGRVVEGAWEPEGRVRFPQACNIPIQGLCADAMLRAIALLFRRLRPLPGGMVACLHDEIVLEVPEDDADRAKAVLERSMTESFAVTFPGAPTRDVVSAGVGRNWMEAKG
jgi:DNA polymerase I-like protein with 3'-5' exonuclease and polymerase domains